MPKYVDSFLQRLSDPLLTVLTLMLSLLLFVIGPMQTAGIVTGQHFGYFFGLVLLPAAFLYSRPPSSRLRSELQSHSWSRPHLWTSSGPRAPTSTLTRPRG
jgi:hypothetical protein